VGRIVTIALAAILCGPLLAGTAILECTASRVEARRARLDFRVSLVAGWHPSGAMLLVHTAAPLRAGAEVVVDVSVDGRSWRRTEAVHGGDGWLKAPVTQAQARAVVSGRSLYLRWRDRAVRLDSRESVRFAPYLIVERPD
jgi:hypothetical protein